VAGLNPTTTAGAQPWDDADLAAQLRVQLYSKLAAALSLAGTPRRDTQSLLSILIPGLYVRPHMDPNDPATQYLISNALNPTLASSWLYQPGAATVTDVYRSILDGKEVPLVELDKRQREQLDAARAYLLLPDGQPTETYRRYLEYELDYLTAQDDYEAALATEHNGGPKVPEQVITARDRAARKWEHDGHRADVERALRTIEALEGLEPHVLWSRLSERFREYTRRYAIDSEYQLVEANPPYQQWFQEFGWSDFRFDNQDFDNQRRAGGAGMQQGCCTECRRPPVPSPPAVPEVVHLATPAFLLTCRVRRIQIIRPWLDTTVLFSRAWRWSTASVAYGTLVSTGGDIAGALTPTGVMPLLPTTAILARDVEIDWQDADGTAAATAACQHLALGRELALGPFRLTKATIDDGGHISMPDPQLIAYISVLIPRCPNPDPTLPWPLHAERLPEPGTFPSIPPAAHG
jgi:hypothetical protein